MSIAELHHFSPFLFWTIVVIASKLHPSLLHFYNGIVESYRTMLGSVLAGPILELDLIHGIILLCFWPLPVAKQIYDPTWHYCGSITNAALQLGLQNSMGHLPPHGRSEREERIRSKTWMACVQVNAMYVCIYS